MIRTYFGLTDNPFGLREIELLEHQQEIYDTLQVHCQQGGLCLVVGTPGTGKSVVTESLKRLPERQYLVAAVARTLHTYTNTVKILCEAFRVEFESSAFKCERRLIEQAFSLNHAGKMLVTIIDGAHLMDMANLHKLRLLFEDFPKNHNLILIGQPVLLTNLSLAVNQDLKSRVTYSVKRTVHLRNRMRETCTSGSVGALGEQSPRATRPHDLRLAESQIAFQVPAGGARISPTNSVNSCIRN
jgi:type II secretory pathway predicted ATPase ExeA